jgi:glycosyltransferase involved in cell wall biosynthesis
VPDRFLNHANFSWKTCLVCADNTDYSGLSRPKTFGESGGMVMRIMEIISGKGVNGAVRHCLLLTREMARRGHQVTLVCRHGSWIARQLASDPVDIVFSELYRWPTDEMHRMVAVLRRKAIDVVHTHMSRAHFFGVLLRWFGGVPCVATAHNRLFQPHWMFNDLVIAVSDATRRYHQTYNLVRADRIVTIHNFIDYDHFAAVPFTARDEIRRELNLDLASRVIGVVGSVIPKKGQIYAVRALPKILAASPSVKLLLVGEIGHPGYADDIKRTAADLGVADHVVWAGERDDVNRILAAVDVSVLPSLGEALGMTILEAMAAGRPVVATNVGGIPECVQSGKTGILVPPRSGDALARAVTRLFADRTEREKLIQAGRQHVRKHFSTESQATAIEAAFSQVVAKRARAA